MPDILIGLLVVIAVALVIVSGGETIGIIGLIERGATHPFLIGLLCAGASLARDSNRLRSVPPRPADLVTESSSGA